MSPKQFSSSKASICHFFCDFGPVQIEESHHQPYGGALCEPGGYDEEKLAQQRQPFTPLDGLEPNIEQMCIMLT